MKIVPGLLSLVFGYLRPRFVLARCRLVSRHWSRTKASWTYLDLPLSRDHLQDVLEAANCRTTRSLFVRDHHICSVLSFFTHLTHVRVLLTDQEPAFTSQKLVEAQEVNPDVRVALSCDFGFMFDSILAKVAHVISLDCHSCLQQANAFSGLGLFTELQVLNLAHLSREEMEVLEVIANLKQLLHLTLSSCDLFTCSETQMNGLAELPCLTELVLDYSVINFQVLQAITRAARLQKLDLSYCKGINDVDLKVLEESKSLQELYCRPIIFETARFAVPSNMHEAGLWLEQEFESLPSAN